MQITAVADGRAVAKAVGQRQFDGLVIGASVGDLLREHRLVRRGGGNGNGNGDSLHRRSPVLVLTDDQTQDGGHTTTSGSVAAPAGTLVRQACSPDRLLDLATFYLHRPVTKLPEQRRQQLLDLHQSDKVLAGKKVLIVDDDMRNIFALSTVLEEHEMTIMLGRQRPRRHPHPASASRTSTSC